MAFRVLNGARWPIGWALVGRPASRVLQSRGWAEVTRCAVYAAGHPLHRRGSCSALYGAAARWARKSGQPILTYTLVTESGASMRGAGWVQTGTVKGRMWDSPSRRRSGGLLVDKIRWSPQWAIDLDTTNRSTP